MQHSDFPSNATTLPPLFAAWMQDFLQAPLPEEPRATCLDCPMCHRSDIVRTEEDHVFNSHTKCCTYIPKVPNFLVGRIFSDDDPASEKGKKAFEWYFRNGAVIRPQGVSPDHDFSLKYRQDANLFGRDEDLRCPYYLEEEGGLCGIWKHRNSTCSTWFCKHQRGDLGGIFWKKMDDLLATVQEILSNWCVQRLEAGSPDFRQWFPLSTRLDTKTRFQQQMYFYKSSLAFKMNEPELYRNLFEWSWGKWLGRETEFFKECARLVNALTWKEIAAITGDEVVKLGEQTKQALDEMNDDQIPERLKRGMIKTAALQNSMVRVWGYAAYDPIDLPESVLKLVRYFNGDTTENVLRRMQAEKGIVLQNDMLRKLLDFGILQKI